MLIEVTKHAGFCTGVRRAVNIAEKTAKEIGKCYCLGELIHNPFEISRLEKLGVEVVKTLDQIPEGGTVLIRSHGASPEIYDFCNENKLKIVDCTCPFVKKLHREVSKHSKLGYHVILVGDKKHPEVLATKGYAEKHEMTIIEDVIAADTMIKMDKAIIVAQTTLPMSLWNNILEVVKTKVKNLVIKKTICSATEIRQIEAKKLADCSDAMIVVGGKNSANTKKLWESCKNICKNTVWVESSADIPSDFTNTYLKKVGVTAGASTPDWSLKEVVTNMMDRENSNATDQELVSDETDVSKDIQETDEIKERNNTSEIEKDIDETNQDVSETLSDKVSSELEVDSQSNVETSIEDSEEVESPQDKAASDFMAGIEATMIRIRRGETVVGTVVQITEDEVCVNIGYKSDGIIGKNELVTKDVEVGDEIEVEVVRLNDGDGNVILSQRNIVSRKAWEALMSKYENNEYVQGIGKEAVKGGLLAEIDGIRAFVPASLLAQRYVEKISDFVDKPMELKIIEVDPQKKRVVASRRAVLDEKQQERKEAAWARLEEGQIVKGIVRRLTDFGAFVDLDGVDGLIHITDLSWVRIKHPSDIVSPNQEVDVEILSLDRETERIQLGYKQLQPHPWDNVEEKYPEGILIKGKVVRITTFGAFVELEPGVDGLVHISQLAPVRVQKVEDVVAVDQIVDIKILKVDPFARRISLSISEAMADLGIQYEYDNYEQEDLDGSSYEAIEADGDEQDIQISEADDSVLELEENVLENEDLDAKESSTYQETEPDASDDGSENLGSDEKTDEEN